MRKILAILLALLATGISAFAETTEAPPEDAIYELYDFEGETLDIEAEYWVIFDDLFRLEMPALWKYYALSEAQEANGMIACFGDGTHFLFIGREEDKGDYADMNEYGMTLALDQNNQGIFPFRFGDADFVCYADYESQSSNCATIIPGKGIYTFYFYPIDGDMEFAQIVVNFMHTYTAIEQE